MSACGVAAHKTEGNPVFGHIGGGHSAVYGPDGRRLTKPIPADEEGFVYADLPMDMLISMRHFADPVGHYSRPELLWLGVDAREKKHVRREGDEAAADKGDTKVNGTYVVESGK
jgi:nitrilase